MARMKKIGHFLGPKSILLNSYQNLFKSENKDLTEFLFQCNFQKCTGQEGLTLSVPCISESCIEIKI